MDRGLIWNAVSAVSTAVAAAASIAIAVAVYRFSRESSRMQAMREINSQWQAWNMAILCNPELARFIHGRKRRQDDKCMSPDDERMFAAVFYQLNILYDMMLAEECGLSDDEFTEALQDDAQSYIFFEQDLLDKILDGSWGYPERFIRRVKHSMRERKNSEATLLKP